MDIDIKNIKKDLERIFDENGVDSSDQQQLNDIDSIQYISIIVEIEQLFNIVLPDFVLSQNKFIDFDRFVSIVTNLYENRMEENDNAMLSNEDNTQVQI